ncbi:adenine phosphoribosyltransferase [Vallitalea longa]|uniref:Adenine phosphoribosyltransferase n=1 Tax=Vallitalea longa TaxID=2936439 RepID=A0A9W5YEX1_9FIRM|nr:phosphoribosyltransferase family protein [Vallitalea longa]GKX31250.1 adenine phosphoribosyltransferase [Vallitalea longa]
MDEIYTLELCGLKRDLPVIQINEDLKIASFVILGDAELVEKSGEILAKKIPEADVLITAEAKGIPLIYEIAKQKGMKKYIVARKSLKPYMKDPLVTKVVSITTQKEQILCLDKDEVTMLDGKNVVIIDDVISTGESINALEDLVNKAGGNVIGKAAILAEGDAANRDDILFLQKLPLFKK